MPGAQCFGGGGAVYILHRRAGRGNREAGQARQEQPPREGGLEHTVLDANICARWGGGGMGGGHQEASWGHKSDLLPAQESRETEASQGKDSEVKRGRQKLVVCKDFQNTADSFWT